MQKRVFSMHNFDEILPVKSKVNLGDQKGYKTETSIGRKIDKP